LLVRFPVYNYRKRHLMFMKTDSSDIRTQVIQLCFAVDSVNFMLDELYTYDDSGRYVDPLALLCVLYFPIWAVLGSALHSV